MKIFKGLWALFGLFIISQSFNLNAQGISRFEGKAITICNPRNKLCVHGLGGAQEGILMVLHGDHNYNQRLTNGRFRLKRGPQGGYQICADAPRARGQKKLCLIGGSNGKGHLAPLRFGVGRPTSFVILSTGRRNTFTICAKKGYYCLHAWGGNLEGKPIRYHGNHKYNRTKANGSFRFNIARDKSPHHGKRIRQRTNETRRNSRSSNGWD